MADAPMAAKRWNRFAHERELWSGGTQLVAGVDEAGCGPLAGPVVAAAVMFPASWGEAGLHSGLRGLNDSKQLTEEQREEYSRGPDGAPGNSTRHCHCGGGDD